MQKMINYHWRKSCSLPFPRSPLLQEGKDLSHWRRGNIVSSVKACICILCKHRGIFFPLSSTKQRSNIPKKGKTETVCHQRRGKKPLGLRILTFQIYHQAEICLTQESHISWTMHGVVTWRNKRNIEIPKKPRYTGTASDRDWTR